jgi:hypothetical protein
VKQPPAQLTIENRISHRWLLRIHSLVVIIRLTFTSHLRVFLENDGLEALGLHPIGNSQTSWTRPDDADRINSKGIGAKPCHSKENYDCGHHCRMQEHGR